MAGSRLDLSVQLPGEALIIKVIDLVLVLADGQTAAQKKKMWDWIIKDIERWRTFWGIDTDPKTLREIFGLPENPPTDD